MLLFLLVKVTLTTVTIALQISVVQHSFFPPTEQCKAGVSNAAFCMGMQGLRRLAS